jgi:phosphoenolpyruvate-protein kinase (PTS system EI component)
MITMAKEMNQLREILLTAARDLGMDTLPALGAMVETPAAALCADEIAQDADFMSIGTNDLTQYTMAAGRENPLVSSYFIDNHPAILKMIHMVVQSIGYKLVAVCGELAASNDAIPLLIENDIRSLSVSPPLIPRIKEIIRQTKLTSPSVSN